VDAIAHRRMIWFAVRTFLGLVAIVLVAAAVVFLLLDVLPGDPARFILGLNATAESVAALNRDLGMEAPAWLRFCGWIGGMLKGDFGFSPTLDAPVAGLLAARLAVTVPLLALAGLLGVALGLPAGILAARRPGALAGKAVAGLARVLAAVPGFWFGMLLVLVFSALLRWLPPGGFVPWSESPLGALASLLMPALALAVPLAASLAQVTREALLEVEHSDFIRAARARGLTLDEALRRHGVRNVLLPVLRLGGVQIAYLAVGALVVENVFYLPGLGRLIFDAVGAHDLVLVRSSLMVLLLLMAGTLFAIELGIGWTDPRRRERSPE
jgi:peptide/nickel transport system permease protein